MEKNLSKKERRELAKAQKQEEKKKKDLVSKIKKFAVWIVAAGIVAFLGYKLVNWFNTPTSQVAGEAVEVNQEDWVKGAEDAKVTIIEYGDFQCPSCASYFPIIKQLLEEFPDDLKVAYRYLPLVQIHKNAIPSAKAAEAAGIQGKFWEMHDKLFENQTDWENDADPFNKFLGYAKELGLEEEKFKSDYESKEVEERVTNQSLEAARLGLNSTPSFFLNGKKIDTPRGFEQFRALILDKLNE
jgi:protein-disulfide isomerase